MTNARMLDGAIDGLPDELYLEVTNRCNLRCATCPQSWGMSEASADLTPRQVSGLLEQLPLLRRVVLHGIGEPTLNPRLVEIIRLVKSRGAYALFNTNGLTLKGSLARALPGSGLDEVRVSIDAATPETYQRVRGADGLERILRNVSLLRAAREQVGTRTPRISLWMTGLRSNIAELPALVRLAHTAGIGEVYLQRLVYSGRGLAQQEEGLFGRATAEEVAAIAAAQELAADLGVVLRGSAEALPDGGAAPAAESSPWRGCRRPWTLMYISANGNALSCCIAPFTATPYDELLLGNAFESSLEELWHGQPYRRWRARMLAGQPPAACASCGSGWAL